MFKRLNCLVLATACLSLALVPQAQAVEPVWQPLPLETQSAYGYSHKLVLDATECTVLSSNVAGKVFPAFNSSATLPAGYRMTSGAIKVVTPFAGNGMTAMTASLGNTTDAVALIAAKGIGTNITANTWYLNTNTVPTVFTAATNLVLTLNPASSAGNGLLTNLTSGRIEIYVGLKDLNKL